MKVGSSGKTGGSDMPKEIAFRYAGALGDECIPQMNVDAAHSLPVVDPDGAAMQAKHPGDLDNACSGRANRGASGGAMIHASMVVSRGDSIVIALDTKR